MDHEIDATYWKCRNGHSLGRVDRNGNNVRVLMLYRQAGDPESCGKHPEHDVICTIEGYVTDVVCSICGAKRTWVQGEESIQHLLERLRRIRNAEL